MQNPRAPLSTLSLSHSRSYQNKLARLTRQAQNIDNFPLASIRSTRTAIGRAEAEKVAAARGRISDRVVDVIIHKRARARQPTDLSIWPAGRPTRSTRVLAKQSGRQTDGRADGRAREREGARKVGGGRVCKLSEGRRVAHT